LVQKFGANRPNVGACSQGFSRGFSRAFLKSESSLTSMTLLKRR
jgi:hypothetical protein